MPDQKILSPIRSYMASSFRERDLADSDDIFALGFGNSLFAIQLVTFVEKEFGVSIESEDLEMDNFRTVQAIAALVERKLVAPAN